MAKPNEKSSEILIPKPKSVGMDVCLVGTSPFICNRMSEKAKRELLLPAGRKNSAQRAISLKHDPIAEFRASPYTLPEEDAPTYLAIMSSSVKRAMAAAALDVPGATKAQIGRLAWIDNQYSEYISIYGVPQLRMAIVRTADMNRTPDVRTTAIIPSWAVRLSVQFVEPQLTYTAVMNLLMTAGLTIGIGDGRPEKGKLNFGQFRVCDPSDPDFLKIVAEGGRGSQKAAMEQAIPYDQESAELLTYFTEELDRRGIAA